MTEMSQKALSQAILEERDRVRRGEEKRKKNPKQKKKNNNNPHPHNHQQGVEKLGSFAWLQKACGGKNENAGEI